MVYKTISWKQTEVGKIPSDWICLSIEKLGRIYNGLSGKSKNDFGIGNALYVPFLNVLQNPIVDKYFLEKVDIKKNERQNVVLKGDLLFNTSSETPQDVGNCSVLLDNIENLYLNSFCFGLRIFNNNASGLFLAYLFKSYIGRNLMIGIAQGSTRYNLSKEIFYSSIIPIPFDKFEQIEIAKVLSDLDRFIDELLKLKNKKEQIRLGVMQELLTGKRRLPSFTEPWNEIRLGDESFAQIFKGSGLSKEKLSETGRYDCILYGELFTTYDEKITNVISKTNYQEGVFSESGDVLLPGSTTTKGIDLADASALLLDDVLLGGDINIIRNKNNKFDPLFLAYFLNSVMREGIERIAKGTTVYHLYGTDLAKLIVKIPSVQEQTAIANSISDMDLEIDAITKKINKYNLIKDGVAAELLSGRIRLVKPKVGV